MRVSRSDYEFQVTVKGRTGSYRLLSLREHRRRDVADDQRLVKAEGHTSVELVPATDVTVREIPL